MMKAIYMMLSAIILSITVALGMGGLMAMSSFVKTRNSTHNVTIKNESHIRNDVAEAKDSIRYGGYVFN